MAMTQVFNHDAGTFVAVAIRMGVHSGAMETDQHRGPIFSVDTFLKFFPNLGVLLGFKRKLKSGSDILL